MSTPVAQHYERLPFFSYSRADNRDTYRQSEQLGQVPEKQLPTVVAVFQHTPAPTVGVVEEIPALVPMAVDTKASVAIFELVSPEDCVVAVLLSAMTAL